MILTNWKTQYKSIKGKDIPVAIIGTGDNCILVLACMHGDEQQGKYIAMKLLAYYEENKLAISNKKMIVVPVVNPDGYELNIRGNARGVDINRNFPTKNWVKSENKDDYFSGDAPSSEPETRTIIDLIKIYKPAFILSFHQPYKIINYDGPAIKSAQLLAKFNKYEILEDIGYPTPGSLGNYAGIERNIPIITLELPENETDEIVWRDNCLGLIAVINQV
ncbi:MAG: M14 family zinc carboxypeptidase [Cyanobacteriota bacterium]